MRKFKKRYVVLPVLAVAVIGGSILGYLHKKEEDSYVKVVNVGEINANWVLTGGSQYLGTLKKGSIVNYKAEEDLEIDSILVRKGDVVSKGDVLYTYDTNSLQLNAAAAENEVKAIENNITVANNELAILKRLQPSENAPKDDEPEEEEDAATVDVPSMSAAEKFSAVSRVAKDTKPKSGSGSADDPYIFFAAEKTVFTKEYLLNAAESEQPVYILAYVCESNGDVQYGRLIDSSKIDASSVSDWVCSEVVTVDAMGGVSADDSEGFAKVIVYPYSFNVMAAGSTDVSGALGTDGVYQIPAEEFDIDAIIREALAPNVNEDGISADDATYEISDKDNYMYSSEELKKLISDKEKEIETLNLNKKQADINLKKAKSKLETGAELATISGKVTFIAKDAKHLSENGYFATITSTSGMSVTSSVGEFSRDELSVGDSVTIQDYSNGGESYKGTITYIGDTPIADNDLAEGDAATESMYEFIVVSNDEFTLDEENSVAITIDGDDDENAICLGTSYIRQENGRFIAMVRNSDGVIEKRVLQTKGGILYGFAVQITGGLSADDYIALPYGNTAEGMPTVEVHENDLYGGLIGMFM